MRVFLLYKNLIAENRVWIKRVSIWAFFCFLAGILTFILNPGLLEEFIHILEQVFRDILGEGELELNFRTAVLIFKNNITVAAISLILGIILGILPLASIAVNFFILGFLVAALLSADPEFLLVSILPHGIIEIPVFILSAAFGARLGLSFGNLKYNLKQNLQILPLAAILFFLAALVEVFVTGNLVNALFPESL